MIKASAREQFGAVSFGNRFEMFREKGVIDDRAFRFIRIRVGHSYQPGTEADVSNLVIQEVGQIFL